MHMPHSVVKAVVTFDETLRIYIYAPKGNMNKCRNPIKEKRQTRTIMRIRIIISSKFSNQFTRQFFALQFAINFVFPFIRRVPSCRLSNACFCSVSFRCGCLNLATRQTKEFFLPFALATGGLSAVFVLHAFTCSCVSRLYLHSFARTRFTVCAPAHTDPSNAIRRQE